MPNTINSYFNFAIKKNASDLHLIEGEKPVLRIDGELFDIREDELSKNEMNAIIEKLLNNDRKKIFEDELELDFTYDDDGVRFRINLHRQSGRTGLAARLIPKQIPTPEELRFEPALYDLPQLLNGLVLVVGPTGCGKSTTIASMIEEINKTKKSHIITIEDPIEFIFEDKKSLIEQREVGIDTRSFSEALKRVLRQDPNIIMVGEMRDPETISTVLTAAETGHLVFSTLHTANAAESIERIIDVFDGGRQKQVLIQLSAVLRAVVAQELLPGADGKRIVAREILINTPAVSNLIRENNISQLNSAIQTGSEHGMITMDKAIKQLWKQNLISGSVAEKRTGRRKKQ